MQTNTGGLVPLAALVAVAILGFAPAGASADPAAAPPHPGYENTVDDSGALRVPDVDFRRDWEHLGTWSLAGSQARGAEGLHVVYTPPGVASHYRKTGEFPDGAVLVKELLKTAAADLTTGHASWGREVEGWFVMVKDRKGRFPGNPLWGDGWGWAYFAAGDERNTTTASRAECLGCHIPAREDDWVYIRAYPALAR